MKGICPVGLTLYDIFIQMGAELEMEPWDTWDAGNQPGGKTQHQTRNYQQLRQQQQQQEEEPEPDYFESMTPVYKKQTKVGTQRL